jgi:predicted RNA-binding protein with PUA-like domain
VKTPVTLKQIKADPLLSGMALVRQSRLSVCPVTPEEWARACALAGV